MFFFGYTVYSEFIFLVCTMKRLVLILITLLSFGSLMTPAVAGTFGFGINDAGGEDETIVATHEIAVGGTKDDQEE
jgi:hypothetical protein